MAARHFTEGIPEETPRELGDELVASHDGRQFGGADDQAVLEPHMVDEAAFATVDEVVPLVDEAPVAKPQAEPVAEPASAPVPEPESTAQVHADSEADLAARDYVEQILRELELEAAAELEAKRQAELEAKRQAELEARRQAELEARRQAELEARRQAELEARRQAELEAKRQAELEAKRQAELEAKRQAELEAKRQAELEAKRQAELEAQRQAELEAQQAEAESEETDMGLEVVDKSEIAAPDPEAVREAEVLPFVVPGLQDLGFDLDEPDIPIPVGNADENFDVGEEPIEPDVVELPDDLGDTSDMGFAEAASPTMPSPVRVSNDHDLELQTLDASTQLHHARRRPRLDGLDDTLPLDRDEVRNAIRKVMPVAGETSAKLDVQHEPRDAGHTRDGRQESVPVIRMESNTIVPKKEGTDSTGRVLATRDGHRPFGFFATIGEFISRLLHLDDR